MQKKISKRKLKEEDKKGNVEKEWKVRWMGRRKEKGGMWM